MDRTVASTLLCAALTVVQYTVTSHTNSAINTFVQALGNKSMEESRIQLIRAISKDALELELEDFNSDRIGYLKDNYIITDEDALDFDKDIVINDKTTNILTKRLCQLTADLSDENAVEFISDSVRSKQIIKDIFKSLF